MNLLDYVPTLDRALRQFKVASDTDSTLAAYLADAVEALAIRWTRDYAITFTNPMTYEVLPVIALKDKRAIILAASIIYKSANVSLAAIHDGDFAYDPRTDKHNPILIDIAELDKLVPVYPRLALASSAPMRGYSNLWNPESYLFRMVI